MSIYLGNLTIDQIQARAGVTFPESTIKWMASCWQQSASNIKPGAWHCFDIPFIIACGDMETAKRLHSEISHLEFKTPMQIRIAQT